MHIIHGSLGKVDQYDVRQGKTGSIPAIFRQYESFFFRCQLNSISGELKYSQSKSLKSKEVPPHLILFGIEYKTVTEYLWPQIYRLGH